jgi:uncharacterized protein YbaR (Trm112 family)
MEIPPSAESECEAIPSWLFEFIRCPISKTTLTMAPSGILRQLLEHQRAKPLVTRGGRTISSLPTQGLLSGDGCWLYPVHQNIPTLIPDEAIPIPPEWRSADA